MRKRAYYRLANPNSGETEESVEQRLKQGEDEANRVLDVLIGQIDVWKSTIPAGCSKYELRRIENRIRTSPPVSPNESESRILKRHVSWKFMRSDRRKESESVALKAVLDEAVERYGQEEVDSLDPDWLRQFSRDTSNRLAGMGPSPYARAISELKGLTVSVLVGQRIRPFIVGDNPVIKLIAEGKHLLDKESEILMPISSDVALSICGPPGVRFNMVLNNRAVGGVNKQTFVQSNEIACRSNEVLESLVRDGKKNGPR